MKELCVDAQDSNLEEVQGFVREALSEAGCSPSIIISIEIAVEEIFVNISHYAYEGMDGVERKALIHLNVTKDPGRMELEFVDWGVPFNPLAKEDADITLSAEERRIGGLGILMVKKTMDSMDYKYEDKKNILSMVKSF